MSSWTSVAEFLAMGGHGLFVWGSLAMCAVTLALELLWLRVRRQALRRQLPTQHGLEASA